MLKKKIVKKYRYLSRFEDCMQIVLKFSRMQTASLWVSDWYRDSFHSTFDQKQSFRSSKA